MVDHSLFFATSRERLACIDRENHLVTVNPAWAELLGDASEGATESSLLDLVHPEDRERVAAEFASVTPPASKRVEGRLRARDGIYRSLELSCIRSHEPAGELHIAAREQGREQALSAELAFLKRRFDAMFAAMQDEVYMTDERGIIDGMSRAPQGVSMESVIGTMMLDWSAPEERGAMEARYSEVREKGKIVAYETTAQYPDDSIQYMSSRMGPILDGDRNVGTVLITRNVTQERLSEEAKHRAEQHVREYMVQLERSNGELERFASVASHDLQEPLRKIQAFSDRLRDRFKTDLPDTARDYLTRMQDAAKRMQDLINDLLMFSRLSVKKQTYTPVNLIKIAKSVLSDLEVRLEEAGGTVNISPLPVIDADPVHMRQLFQNLIGNALKFARVEAPPIVNISAEVEAPPAGAVAGSAMVRLRIEDNGIGIEPRFHERIFGIFERLHGREKYEGTGIGLAVCRKIVEQHNGSIEIASVVGEGTTFMILLPMKQLERSQQK
ncbi:MAG: PAS domain S-box protein [Nannocystis sp.]|nr:ATP-binding protein [Nannocystis sp.]MBA3548738.1 PAS domain S-box protein [Nannocystis sp.]